MAMIFAVVVSLVVLIAVLSPFWIGEGGALVSSSSVKDPARLKAIKEALVKRYVADEKAMEEGLISKSAWDQRMRFLSNRYIDVARQYDYLSYVEAALAKQQSSGPSTESSHKES
jgi:hypothetical protein